MTKLVKQYIWQVQALILFLLILGLPTVVSGKEISLEKLHIHTYIHKDGSATFTEKRETIIHDGTEMYLPIGNLGKSTIVDFTVTEDGKAYDFIEQWDIDASRKQKTHKNGLIKMADGYELVWGIGNYGSHTYILQYRVTDFIKQLTDDQMIFWRFINDYTNIPPKQVIIEIETENNDIQSKEMIWGFGFHGTIDVKNNKAIITANEAFSPEHHATILVHLADGKYETKDILQKSFQDVFDEAMVGADFTQNQEEEQLENDDEKSSYPQSNTDDHHDLSDNNKNNLQASGQEDSPSVFTKIKRTIGNSLFFELFIAIILLLLFFLLPFFIIKLIISSVKHLRYKLLYKRMMRKTEGELNKDLPFKLHYHQYIYLFSSLGLTNVHTILSAFFMKWTLHDNINLHINKANKMNIKFNSLSKKDPRIEQDVFNIFLKASGKDRLLTYDENNNWGEDDKQLMDEWLENMMMASENYLINEGLLEVKNHRVKRTSLWEKEAVEVFKFIKFLLELTDEDLDSFTDKQVETYMFWAVLLGIEGDFVHHFDKLFSDKYKQTSFRKLFKLIFATILIHQQAIKYVSDNASKKDNDDNLFGGGGGTSIGGGSGFFGGGSGGGVR